MAGDGGELQLSLSLSQSLLLSLSLLSSLSVRWRLAGDGAELPSLSLPLSLE